MHARSSHSTAGRFFLLFIVLIFFSILWMGPVPAGAKIIEGMQADTGLPAVLDRENPQIQAVMAIQDHYSPALFSVPDVVGTATGLTEQGNPAVIVFTRGAGAAGIPTRLGGVPVVVKMTGEFRALKPGGKGGNSTSTTSVWTPPVPIGVSTGNIGECSAGTIGARLTDGTDYYALSNNHVYALENDAAIGSTVLQPGLYDSQCSSSGDNVIGDLAYFIPIHFGGGTNTVDAAIADVYRNGSGTLMVGNATPSDGYATPSSTTAEPVIGASVEKYGRTSKLTVGTITAINASIVVGYSSGYATFSNQIIVQSGKPFVKAGDSGSLVVTAGGLNPVGLLFAGDSSGKYAVVNDIDAVLGALSGLTHSTLRIDGN